jgi:diguanylate cyclase (GGDEF)-like protein
MMVDWKQLPDVSAVALLVCAFASVARRNQTRVSGIWLTGWSMIVLHFGAFIFQNVPGAWGTFAVSVGLAALTWAGTLFMWACIPYRQETSSRWMLGALIFTNTLYVFLSNGGSAAPWMLNVSAILFGALPLIIALASVRKLNHPLRWVTVCLYSALSIFALIFQNRSGNGADLAMNAVLCTVYLGCCAHFLLMYRRATAGAFITIAGFLAWAAVFVVGPMMEALWPAVQVESEVWNLPKYVVAVGMILLLLEDQIEYNKYLALHDDLTGLPNRRLFQDRLGIALERARRTETQTALLVIDLDHFKEVNDSLGHHVGDLLLQRVATLFSERVRRSDTVARTGGDEFSIILEEPTSHEEAILVGRSLMQILSEAIEIGQHKARVGASIGIAVFPQDAPDMETLCIAADLRMYDVKRGCGQHVVPLMADPESPLPALEFQAIDRWGRAASSPHVDSRDVLRRA